MAKKRKDEPKYVREKATCPVCQEERDTAPILAVEKKVAHYRTTPGWAVDLAKKKYLKWACLECLGRKHAIAADPSKQVYCCDIPWFAYCDKTLRCRDCENEFVFSASEHQFWYEELRFILSSYPVRCAPCRKKLRAARRANDELAQALAGLDPNNGEQLAHVSSLYLTLGLRAKAADYLRRAKNKTWQKSRWDALVKRLEEIEAQPAETVIDVLVGGRTLRFRERR